jgi:Mitochondrial carrier protein
LWPEQASGVVASFLATPADVVKTSCLSQDKWSQQRRKTPAEVSSTSSASPQPLHHPFPPIAISLAGNSTALILETFTDQQFVNADNPWAVFCDIIERDGPEVLFSGVTERCLGGIPRFGTTMASTTFWSKRSVMPAGCLIRCSNNRESPFEEQ